MEGRFIFFLLLLSLLVQLRCNCHHLRDNNTVPNYLVSNNYWVIVFGGLSAMCCLPMSLLLAPQQFYTSKAAIISEPSGQPADSTLGEGRGRNKDCNARKRRMVPEKIMDHCGTKIAYSFCLAFGQTGHDGAWRSCWHGGTGVESGFHGRCLTRDSRYIHRCLYGVSWAVQER